MKSSPPKFGEEKEEEACPLLPHTNTNATVCMTVKRKSTVCYTCCSNAKKIGRKFVVEFSAAVSVAQQVGKYFCLMINSGVIS